MTPTRRRLHVALPIIALQLGCSDATIPPEPVPPTHTPQVTEQYAASPVVGEEGWTSEVHVRDGSGDAHQHPDPDIPDTVLEAALDTAEGFLAAWLTDDQHLRRHLLTGIAAPTLADSFDDARFRTVAGSQHGPTHVLSASPLQVITRHRLDTDAVVDLTLIRDPASRHGWIVIRVTEH